MPASCDDVDGVADELLTGLQRRVHAGGSDLRRSGDLVDGRDVGRGVEREIEAWRGDSNEVVAAWSGWPALICAVCGKATRPRGTFCGLARAPERGLELAAERRRGPRRSPPG